jgi:hypothetical protein
LIAAASKVTYVMNKLTEKAYYTLEDAQAAW